MSTRKAQAAGSKQFRILIVDDHPATRVGMARLVEEETGLKVCGEADNTKRALVAVKALKPQVVLVDLSMPGGEGLEFVKNLKALHPEVAVLVVSMHDEELYAGRVLRAGAKGYVMKSAGGEEMIRAIRRVLQGKVYLSDNMSAKVLEIFYGKSRPAGDAAVARLTDREFEVFQLLGQGLTTREIGRVLRMGVKTVETHRLHIREKLQIKSGPALIQQAVRWADAQGLL